MADKKAEEIDETIKEVPEETVQEEPVNEDAETTEPEVQEIDEVQDESLPFPNAVVVRQIKKGAPGKMISSKVKVASNQFLGEVVRSIAKEMNTTRYSMVEMDDFLRATKPYRFANELDKEKERVVEELERMRSDIDSLIREFQRKFALAKADDLSVLQKE
ncbi:MAG: hypothetical protein KAJ91_01895 [Candidatus Aenigmarchaeota archaeon]|nr:hypothetical protein [Candidatus Aenigmarchaeota archaeon]